MRLIDRSIKPSKYIDYPPTYDRYNLPKVEYEIEAGINIILRLLYCKSETMPSLPDMFIGIEQYKHNLATELNTLALRDILQSHISAAVNKLEPSVDLTVNKNTGMCTISIILRGDNEIVELNLNNAQDSKILEITIDKKNFNSI